MRMATLRRSRSRSRDREHVKHSKKSRNKPKSKKKNRDRSLSSALSDISSSSSCFRPSKQAKGPVKHKKKKKDKEKRIERRKEKKEKRRHKVDRIIAAPTKALSKEIYASGSNILVSVSFGDKCKDGEIGPTNRRSRRRKVRHRERNRYREEKPDEGYEPAGRNKTNAKPVAIIDLDMSPGREIFTSPKYVIVLSDEEEGKESNITDDQLDNLHLTTPSSSIQDNDPIAKSKTSKQRATALFDAESDLIESECNKIGPNTPPDPVPKSPDTYNPFEPTKSPSMSPSSDILLDTSVSRHTSQHESNEQNTETNASSPASIDLSNADMYDDGILDIHPTSPYDKIEHTSPPNKSPIKVSTLKIVPAKTVVYKKVVKPQIPAAISSSSSSAAALGMKRLCDDFDNSAISPYSPNSSDYDDLFDPPKSTTSVELTAANLKKAFGNDKETLYGSLRRPIKKKPSRKKVVKAPITNKKPGTTGEEFGMDDIPNSAVDLQVKDKFLKKFHRQIRVVEEVKLVLKPYFTKKLLSKDEYKDILRRSVPKICHSRTGEINPAKIQALIDAYVQKTKTKRKFPTKAVNGNAIVSSTTATS